MSARAPTPPNPVMQLEVSGNGPALVLVGGGLTGALSWAPHAERLSTAREVGRAQPLAVQHALEERRLPDGYGIRMESSVRSLVLIEPPAFWVLPDHGRSDPEVRKLEESERRWAYGLSEDDLAAFVSEVALVPPGQSPREHPRWPIWVRHRQALAASYAEFDHQDDPDRLRSLRQPVLLVIGEGTTPYFRSVTDALAEALPNARVLELPGGHAAPMVSMDRFLAEMAAFHAASAP